MKTFFAIALILSVLATRGESLLFRRRGPTNDPQEKERGSSTTKRIVNFHLYTRENGEKAEVVSSTNLKEFKLIKPGRPTKVIIHGWMGDYNCRFSKPMRQGLLSKLNINLIVVDWSNHGSKSINYVDARRQIQDVGRTVAQFLDLLAAKNRVQLSELHVLGFSLGAHISGIAGNLVKMGKIARITGLDPAGPGFSQNDQQGRLSTDSAQFVDVIHTAGNFLGIGIPIGHVDFYPNGGKAKQPGCIVDVGGLCSHERSYYYYLDSIDNPRDFAAVQCDDWESFTQKKCKNNNVVHMGETTPKTARGEYYFQTNSRSPYGKQRSGTVYS